MRKAQTMLAIGANGWHRRRMIALALLLAAPPQLRIVAEPPASVTAAEGGVTVFALNEGAS